MTDAERALLLAVARYMLPAEPQGVDPIRQDKLALWTAIKRVEFEAAHPPEAM